MEKEFIVANEQGLHARPATTLVNLANSFKCDIFLTYNGIEVDLKSIMGVLSLGVKRGSQIKVRTSGVDEVEALNGIAKQLTDFNLR